MEKICRFCLKESSKNITCSLQECDILFNIQKYLTIEIPTEDLFPSKLCKECFKKISLIIKFCITVKENEDKLQYYSKNGLLQDYYTKITNNMPINDEQKELIMKTHEIVEDDTSTDLEDYDLLINEQLSDDNNNTHCSSDDKKKLSSIKKEKEINTNAPVKKLTIFRPVKSLISKKKKKKEPEKIEYIKPFTCLTCLKEFNSQADLTKHYYTEHYRKKTVDNNFTEHILEDKTMYSCDSCEEIFNLKKDIVKHVMSHTSDRDERPLICKLCARTYKTVPEIVRHARAHNGFKLECPYNCGFTTAYQGAMKEHKNRHLDEYKYTCKTCGKGFNIKTWYEQHQNLHTGEKPFVCNICGVAFPLSRYLQTHKSSMHPQSSSLKRYRCVHCDEMCDSSKSLAIHLQVLTALSFYATGSYQKPVGMSYLHGLSQASVSKAVKEVTIALNTQSVLRKHIRFPQTQLERNNIINGFSNKFEFPGCVGCIDCTHVALIQPSDHEERFFNRKHYHSRNVQIICDSDLNIINIDASFGGATHDAYIWRNCEIQEHLQELHSRGETVWLLGDSGYPLRPWLLTPIVNAEPNSADEHYTNVHCLTRNTVERCIGVLKARWRCLLAHRVLHYDHHVVAMIINACAVLHNICNKHQLPVSQMTNEDIVGDLSNQVTPQPQEDASAGAELQLLARGRQQRDRIVQRLWSARRL